MKKLVEALPVQLSDSGKVIFAAPSVYIGSQFQQLFSVHGKLFYLCAYPLSEPTHRQTHLCR